MSLSKMSNTESLVFHCNSCLVELGLFDDAPKTGPRGDKVHKRFWTKCYHVLCNNCKLKGGQTCAACRKPTAYMEISEAMEFHFKVHFQPLDRVKNLERSIISFQRSQSALVMNNMIEQLNRLHVKYQQSEREHQVAKDDYNHHIVEHKKVKIIFDRIVEHKRESEENSARERQLKKIKEYEERHRTSKRRRDSCAVRRRESVEKLSSRRSSRSKRCESVEERRGSRSTECDTSVSKRRHSLNSRRNSVIWGPSDDSLAFGTPSEFQ